jgi:hypothetical protein
MNPHFLLLLALLAVPVLAQSSPEKMPALDHAQSVLATKIVHRGKDTLSYRRVTPPSARALTPLLDAAPPLAVDVAVPGLNHPAAALAAPASTEPRFFGFNLTPHLFGVHELTWVDDQGRTKRVFVREEGLAHLASNFHVPMGEDTHAFDAFSWSGPAFSHLADYPSEPRRHLERARRLAVGAYFSAPTPDGHLEPLTEAERDALDVLLAHVAVNRAELKTAHLAAVAHAEAEAEARRIEEQKPKQIEIRYWPVQSQRHATNR